jgi:hypothetical protein
MVCLGMAWYGSKWDTAIEVEKASFKMFQGCLRLEDSMLLHQTMRSILGVFNLPQQWVQ